MIRKKITLKEISFIVGFFLAIFFSVFLLDSTSTQNFSTLASKIVSECKKESYRPLCYEKKVPALMDKGLSMEGAYEVTKIIQTLDPDYHYCHVLAHNISAKETSKDPSKWKEVVAHSPSGICGNGGLHGAFQERFRTDALPNASTQEITDELKGACDPHDKWNPTFLERSSCMHGLGHLTMYITAGNIRKSITLCNKLAKPSKNEDFSRTCIDGAFMQIFQPLEPEDKALVKNIVPTKNNRTAFCEKFEGIDRTSCIKESWPLVVNEIMTPKGFTDLCAPLSKSYEEYRYCTSGVIYTVFGRLEYDTKKMMDFCSQLSGLLQNICISRTASRFIETDWKNIPEAISVCENAPISAKDSCFNELVYFAGSGLHKNSSEEKSLCSKMPENWRSRCFNVSQD